MASLIAQLVKNLPAMQETRLQSLDQEDSLGSYILCSMLPSLYYTFLLSHSLVWWNNIQIIDLPSQ